MAFTDRELAGKMAELLVHHNVMTPVQLKTLDSDRTELKVLSTLTKSQLENFTAYWTGLAKWLESNGGDITKTNGTDVPGRGKPSGLAAIALYNDAFRDVQANLANLKLGKAISNHLRFVAVMGSDDDD